MKIRIKICGITRDEDLVAAIGAGADAIGFVVGVPTSKRNLSPEKAASLVRQVPVFTSSVLVMVPNTLSDLTEIYDRVRPDILQIHGKGVPKVAEIRQAIPGATLIKGIRSEPGRVLKAAEEAWGFDAVLLDTFIPGKHGGTGITNDWWIGKKIRENIGPERLILAGGLTPINIWEAIQTVRPYAVDVSTGVESSPGIKDHEKIASFIGKVKEIEL